MSQGGLIFFNENEMSLDNIMSNIYGESSSQQFDKVSLLKTQYRINRRSANVRYVDAPSENLPKGEPYTHRHVAPSYALSGGGKRKVSGGENIPVVSSPEYVKDKELQDFIHTFHLHYLFSNIRINAIIVTPTAKVLEELKADFLARLKEEGITDPASKEASIVASKKNLKFKNYIFDVYGESSQNNDGYEYKLDTNFPDVTGETDLRRTNRNGHAYYLRVSKGKCIISNSKKMTKPCELKLIGKCDRAAFVFKGDIPEPEADKLKTASVVTASLSGGAKRAANKQLRDYFARLVQKYDNDVYAAAEDFVVSVGLAEVARTGDVAKSAKKVANYCSADLLHSAMSMIFADDELVTDDKGTKANKGEDGTFNGVNINVTEELTSEDTNAMGTKILDYYTPRDKSINMKTASAAIDSLYAKSTTAMSPYEASRVFVNDIMKMYGKFPPSMFKADVATAMLSSHRVNDDTIKHVFAVVDAIDDIVDRTGTSSGSNPLFKEQASTMKGITSGLTNAIYAAYSERPFAGLTAKCGIPIFSKRKVSKRLISGDGKCTKGKCKGKSSGSKKSKRLAGKKAFEEDPEENGGLSFNLIESSVLRDEMPEKRTTSDDEPLVTQKVTDDILIKEETSSGEEHDQLSDEEPEQSPIPIAPASANDVLSAFLRD